jgi:hypothetical protein
MIQLGKAFSGKGQKELWEKDKRRRKGRFSCERRGLCDEGRQKINAIFPGKGTPENDLMWKEGDGGGG